jgi:GPH family glycoside/pentoside/hexuronide:cation symporter
MVDSILDPPSLGAIAPNPDTSKREVKAVVPPLDPEVERDLKSVSTKVFYGLGSIAFGVKDNGFQTILLPFYNLVLHVPAQLVGLAIFIALVVDAFLDPIVGQISDNLRTRWGRRHPLMYLSALPVAVSYLLLWNPPAWSPHALFFYLIVVAIIVRTFITFYEIPSSALVPELTEDYDERTSFIGYRVFFGWYGGLTMSALAFLVFMRTDATHTVGQLNPVGYSHYGLTAALVMFVAILFSSAGTHRFIPYFRQPAARPFTLMQYAKEMLATLNNKAFLILLAAAIFFNLATGLVFALNFYVNTFFWKLNNSQIGILTLAAFIAVLLAFVISPPLSRRLGKKLSAGVMFAIGLAINSTPLVLGLLGILTAKASGGLLALLFVFTTLGSALAIGSSIMLISMIADIVEDSEIRTGRRSEGLFFAGSSFIQKASSGLGLFASGLVLWAAHFPTDKLPGHIDPHVVWNFCIVYLSSSVGLYGIGFLIISFFPITRATHNENLRQLIAEAALATPPFGGEALMTAVASPDSEPRKS